MRILLTAFEPYDQWDENSSWLTLVDLLRDAPQNIDLITRRYPVDLIRLKECLERDLDPSLDVILHLGQCPGAAAVKLEAFAINVAGRVDDQGKRLPPLVEDGPPAFQSNLPLGRWAEMLHERQIPAVVSYHAGTFLCNATMYLTHHWFHQHDNSPKVGFIHLPLSTDQVVQSGRHTASLPLSIMTAAVRLILQDLVEHEFE